MKYTKLANKSFCAAIFWKALSRIWHKCIGHNHISHTNVLVIVPILCYNKVPPWRWLVESHCLSMNSPDSLSLTCTATRSWTFGNHTNIRYTSETQLHSGCPSVVTHRQDRWIRTAHLGVNFSQHHWQLGQYLVTIAYLGRLSDANFDAIASLQGTQHCGPDNIFWWWCQWNDVLFTEESRCFAIVLINTDQ